MPHPFKFNTPSRVLTIRVPADQYDKIKADFTKIIKAYVK